MKCVAVTGAGCLWCEMLLGAERAAEAECPHARPQARNELFGRGPLRLRTESDADRLERLSAARDGRVRGVDR